MNFKIINNFDKIQKHEKIAFFGFAQLFRWANVDLGCHTSTERGRLGLLLSAKKLAKLHNAVGDIVENVTFFA